MLPFGVSIQEIQREIGKPLEVNDVDGMQMLLYKSPSLTLSDLYYVQDGKLVLQSFSHYADPVPMSQFLSQFGNPTQSVRRYENHDSLNTIVHMWPHMGIAVTTTGENMDVVIREEHFSPITLAEYLATWGKNIKDHQQISIASVAIPSPSISYQKQANAAPAQWIGWGMGTILLLIFCAFWLKRKKVISTKQ